MTHVKICGVTSVEDALTRAAKAIREADLVALACHVNPDGDALGSMLALHHVLRAASRWQRSALPASRSN